MCRKEVGILEELREGKQYCQNTLYKLFLKKFMKKLEKVFSTSDVEKIGYLYVK